MNKPAPPHLKAKRLRAQLCARLVWLPHKMKKVQRRTAPAGLAVATIVAAATHPAVPFARAKQVAGQ